MRDATLREALRRLSRAALELAANLRPAGHLERFYLIDAVSCEALQAEQRIAQQTLGQSEDLKLSSNIKDSGSGGFVAVTPDIPWLYPQQIPPPRGAKLFLLTQGGVATTGTWVDDGSFIAYHPIFRRDREYERSIGVSK